MAVLGQFNGGVEKNASIHAHHFYSRRQTLTLQGGMFLASRGEHVLVHETEPEMSDAF